MQGLAPTANGNLHCFCESAISDPVAALDMATDQPNPAGGFLGDSIIATPPRVAKAACSGQTDAGPAGSSPGQRSFTAIFLSGLDGHTFLRWKRNRLRAYG